MAGYSSPKSEMKKPFPAFTDQPFVKALVRDWQVSGVTRLLSGA